MQFGVQHPETKIVSWAADLPLTAFTRLITEALHQLNGDLGIRENDMEIFEHLITCKFSITRIPTRFYDHLNEIKDLILNHNFIPFPTRPRTLPTIERYPSEDGYEHNKYFSLIQKISKR
ncbi:hypothetical protein C1645_827376 [Glomus cerebriforme]|uniref:Uncharacterized protein n=1 Tax=Glomus cerebriforme TaxID=658196 RepID=A0A397SYA1_9GLOM|nr:hypothetical protein C1645_827376 [Glomus cerebriforme]